MKKSIYIVQALAIGAIALAHTVQAATPSAQTLAFTCAGCHGANGNSAGPATPSIAGLDAKYIIESMQAFKSDERANTIMGRVARGYSDEEIALVAEYFAAQKTSTLSTDKDNNPLKQLQHEVLAFLSSNEEMRNKPLDHVAKDTANPLEVKR